MSELGRAIRKFRASEDMNQDEFADKLGVSRGAVSAWERGEYEPNDELKLKVLELIGEMRGDGSDLPSNSEGLRLEAFELALAVLKNKEVTEGMKDQAGRVMRLVAQLQSEPAASTT